MKLAFEKYLGHLDGMDLSEAEKEELLKALWSVMTAVTDHAFGLDRPQISIANNTLMASAQGSDDIKSSTSLNNKNMPAHRRPQ